MTAVPGRVWQLYFLIVKSVKHLQHHEFNDNSYFLMMKIKL